MADETTQAHPNAPLARYGIEPTDIERQFYEDFDTVVEKWPEFKLTGETYVSTKQVDGEQVPFCGCVAGVIALAKLVREGKEAAKPYFYELTPYNKETDEYEATGELDLGSMFSTATIEAIVNGNREEFGELEDALLPRDGRTIPDPTTKWGIVGRRIRNTMKRRGQQTDDIWVDDDDD